MGVTAKPRITVVGSFMMDLMSKTPRLPVPGETVMGGPFKMGPGGKGSNQAVAAARLGAQVTIVVSLGTDYFGDIAYANLEQEGIDTRFVKSVDKAHTGAALIMVDDAKAENMIVVASGANELLTPEDVDAAADAMTGADFLVLQLEVPLETVEYTAQLAATRGVPLILNPAPARPLSPALLERVRLLTPNETEAELITGVPVTDIQTAEAAAKRLVGWGVKEAIITLGAKGALVATAEGCTHVPGFQVDVVDSTGAGDAFNGGLAVALAEGKTLLDAVRFSNATAALSVTRVGTAPAMPRREEVLRLLAEQG
jgi:ribokinase